MHVSPQYRRKLHLRQSQIHFFLGEGRASGFPAKIGGREKVSGKSGFSCTHFQTLATSLSTDLPTGFKGPLLSSKRMVGRGGEKEKEGREREGENYRVPPSTFENNLTASTLSCT